ncbi:MAG: hypothetical protein DMG08_29395, partial [Acidobacteria bacterium]
WADTHGRLFYGCDLGMPPVNAPGAENAGAIAEGPLPYDQTFFLHSRPLATRKIYLDFDGQTTSGTAWNGGATIVSAPFDLNGIPSSFNTTEMDVIQHVWQRVAEDYAPFDVDVTTQDPGSDGLRRTSTSDVGYGIRVVISPTNWYNINYGGVAYLDVFNAISSTDIYGTCWAFTQQLGNGEKAIAEAASHEVGHTLGLHHDGLTVCCDALYGGTTYYSGQGNWAPIMGVSYNREVSQWSKGEYANANNTEDDLAIIQGYISYRADDHGDTIGTATPLTGPDISASGVIEKSTDVDMFSFQTGAGTISFTVNPAPRGPDLDISATLYDGTGNLVTSADGAGLSASFTVAVATGTYYLMIDGVGSGDPVTTGYSDYASLGQYQITGTVIPTGTQPVAKASASPASGVMPLPVNFSSDGSYDPNGTIQSHYWDFADGSNSTDANPSHTYTVKGNYTATLVVTDNDGLSASKTVAITVSAPNQAPVANAAANATSGYAPLAVGFSSAGSSDSDGSIASYSWAFGDGTTSTSSNPSHTYSTPGSYIAVLTVTDNQGVQGTSSPVTITTQQDPTKLPDMIVSSLTTSVSGTSITVKDTTKNQGLSPAAASTTFIYFSNDATLDAGDTLIGSRAVGVLAAGGSSTVTTVLPIPANALPGTRYVIVVADGGNTVGESIENNNAKTKSITVTGPDLLVSSLSAPSSAKAGSTITVNDTTKNQGGKPTGIFTTNFYLS